MFEKLFKLSEQPLQVRYNFLLLGIIVALCFLIWFMNGLIVAKKEEKSNQHIEHVAKEASYEARLSVCQDQYLRYLEKSEREYKELLFETKRLKEKSHDSH